MYGEPLAIEVYVFVCVCVLYKNRGKRGETFTLVQVDFFFFDFVKRILRISIFVLWSKASTSPSTSSLKQVVQTTVDPMLKQSFTAFTALPAAAAIFNCPTRRIGDGPTGELANWSWDIATELIASLYSGCWEALALVYTPLRCVAQTNKQKKVKSKEQIKRQSLLQCAVLCWQATWLANFWTGFLSFRSFAASPLFLLPRFLASFFRSLAFTRCSRRCCCMCSVA